MIIYLYTVHEDAHLTQPTTTPAKLPQTSNVLSIRKKEFEEWNVPMFISEPFDPKVQPQYCKHKVNKMAGEMQKTQNKREREINIPCIEVSSYLLLLECVLIWSRVMLHSCYRAKLQKEEYIHISD